MLAVAKLGAVIGPAVQRVSASTRWRVRLEDASVKAMLTADGTRAAGPVRTDGPASRWEAVQLVASVHTVVVTSRLGTGDEDGPSAPASRCSRGRLPHPSPSTTVDVSTDHPLLLAYTSGTTGRPQGRRPRPRWVAGEGPRPRARFQHDLGASDTFALVQRHGLDHGAVPDHRGPLQRGRRCASSRAPPDHPGPDRLWRIVAESGGDGAGVEPDAGPAGADAVTVRPLCGVTTSRRCGCSARRASRGNEDAVGVVLRRRRRRALPDHQHVGGHPRLAGALLSPHPVQPNPAGGRSWAPALGIAADVFDAAGRPVRDQVGELVCTKPWPGMTQGLHGDRERYLDTYWSRWARRVGAG